MTAGNESMKERSQTGMWNAIDQNGKDTAVALEQAKQALGNISFHETLCAERYGNLQKSASDTTVKFTLLFSKVDKLAMLVYIGVGVWVAIPVISGAVFGVIQLVRIFHGQ